MVADRGRPADEDGSRDSRLSVRCRAAQRAAWVEAAAIRGVELSSVARDLLDAWAERTLTAEPAVPAHAAPEQDLTMSDGTRRRKSRLA